jgi:hypothetical protein
MSQGLTADFDSTAFPLTLTLTKEDVGGLTGLSPTVSVRLGSDETYYLDWDDQTFKTSGWVDKATQMVEVGGGHYTKPINISTLIGVSPGDSLIPEFAVDGGDDLKGAASDTIVLVSSFAKLKEIWQILGLDSSQPLIVSATDRATGSNIAQTITVVGGTVTVERV